MANRICSQCGEAKPISAKKRICNECRAISTGIANGRIRSPDYKEVNTYNYKEPMRKVENGYGYYGAVTVTNDKKHVQCHICGYYFASLSNHVPKKHKIPAKEYKVTFGLRLGEGLQSPLERERKQKQFNETARMIPGHMELLQDNLRRGRATNKENGHKYGGNTWTAQTRNERGKCRDQTLAKIHALMKNKIGTITKRDFIREYGEDTSVYFWFGTWSNAMNEAGYESARQKITRETTAKRQRMLDNIRAFYEKYGHSPMSSDFNSDPTLSNHVVISRTFGNLNRARKLAQVPQVVHLNGRWQEIEDDDSVLPNRLKGAILERSNNG